MILNFTRFALIADFKHIKTRCYINFMGLRLWTPFMCKQMLSEKEPNYVDKIREAGL